MRLFAFIGLLFVSGIAVAEEEYPWQLKFQTSKGVFQLSEFADEPIVLSFFFTSCKYACPLQTAKLAKVQKNLSEQVKNNTSFVSISIDNDTDSLEKIDSFSNQFGADTEHWLFGRAEEQAQLDHLLEQLALAINKDSVEIDHEMTVFLIDAKGNILQQYVGTSLEPVRVANDLTHITFKG